MRKVADIAAKVSLSQRNARLSGLPRIFSIELALAHDDTRLRAAQKLVSGERNDARAGLDALFYNRFMMQTEAAQIDQRAGSQIFHHVQPVFGGQPAQVGERYCGGEADHTVVGWMYLEEQGGFGSDRFGIVA